MCKSSYLLLLHNDLHAIIRSRIARGELDPSKEPVIFREWNDLETVKKLSDYDLNRFMPSAQYLERLGALHVALTNMGMATRGVAGEKKRFEDGPMRLASCFRYCFNACRVKEQRIKRHQRYQ
jgi:hypothetical protein